MHNFTTSREVKNLTDICTFSGKKNNYFILLPTCSTSEMRSTKEYKEPTLLKFCAIELYIKIIECSIEVSGRQGLITMADQHPRAFEAFWAFGQMDFIGET